jgi:hypothetical protein
MGQSRTCNGKQTRHKGGNAECERAGEREAIKHEPKGNKGRTHVLDDHVVRFDVLLGDHTLSHDKHRERIAQEAVSCWVRWPTVKDRSTNVLATKMNHPHGQANQQACWMSMRIPDRTSDERNGKGRRPEWMSVPSRESWSARTASSSDAP